MRVIILKVLSLVIILCSFQSESFKEGQLKYSRVRQAYIEKEAIMSTLLQDKKIDREKLQIYLRAFKSEKLIELWGKNDTDSKYTLIKTYKICQSSGKIGPKRQQGDLQVPEGFYHINIFKPYSNFYLSLGINYPNKSDRILGVKGNLGGDIFLHGACVTIGCLPIRDEMIKELYIFCVEARNLGQLKIPVTIFPSMLSEAELNRLTDKYKGDSDKVGLWEDLKKAYDSFNSSKQLPKVTFLDSGRHNIE